MPLLGINCMFFHIYLPTEHNKPPVANAGSPKNIWMPTDEAVLDGSNSTDDQKVTEYIWKQIRYVFFSTERSFEKTHCNTYPETRCVVLQHVAIYSIVLLITRDSSFE